MTQRERAIIIEALRELMEDDGDFHAAIAKLCKLVEYEYPADRVLQGAKIADFRELASRPNRQFMVKNNR